jgi:hypothetical protein
MALRDWLKPAATAISAIPAAQEPRIARIARIAVAAPLDQTSTEAPLDARTEVRRLVEEIASVAPSYWTLADVEEAVTIAMTDVDSALRSFRAIAEHCRRMH